MDQRLEPGGIRCDNEPPTRYGGIALYVARNGKGEPLAAWDGDGTAVFLASGVQLTLHDSGSNFPDREDVRAVLEARP